jgi:hypothetical protein
MDGSMSGDIFSAKQAGEVIEGRHAQADGTHEITIDA